MRELTADELHMVGGAGFWSSLWNWLVQHFTIEDIDPPGGGSNTGGGSSGSSGTGSNGTAGGTWQIVIDANASLSGPSVEIEGVLVRYTFTF